MAGRRYRKRGAKRLPRQNKTKKLVTGQGPTFLEKLAVGGNSIAQLARAVAPAISMINTEVKYFDSATSNNAYNPGTSDALFSVTSGIAQGLTDVTRIGDSILAKNIAVKLDLLWAPAVSVLNSFSRIIMFVWKENLQQNPPTIAKLFTTPANFLSGFNKDYTDQMVVLKDKVVSHNAQIASTAVQAVMHMKFFKKLDFHMRFQGPNNTDATVNHIYFCYRNTSVLVGNNLVVDNWSRLNYTDN